MDLCPGWKWAKIAGIAFIDNIDWVPSRNLGWCNWVSLDEPPETWKSSRLWCRRKRQAKYLRALGKPSEAKWPWNLLRYVHRSKEYLHESLREWGVRKVYQRVPWIHDQAIEADHLKWFLQALDCKSIQSSWDTWDPRICWPQRCRQIWGRADIGSQAFGFGQNDQWGQDTNRAQAAGRRWLQARKPKYRSKSTKS